MKLIDTHAHLYDDRYDQDRVEMMQRTLSELEAVICIGTDLTSSRQATTTAAQYDRVWATVGVHPHHSGERLDELEQLASSPKVVAIGECGLDFKPYRNLPVDQTSQQQSLRVQVELANKLNLPVVIHARDSWEDLVPLLNKLQPNSGVVHSFTGGLREANQLISLGLLISFSGMITYPANQHLREVARIIPLDKFVVETDAPYLPPQPMRGQRSEPVFVKMTVAKIAEVRGASLEEITAATSQNAIKLFRLPL